MMTFLKSDTNDPSDVILKKLRLEIIFVFTNIFWINFNFILGNGPEAKKGKLIGMYYDGKLKSNMKRFDATLNGKPFKFRLGAGEVIKGWDAGIEGMKVGGKRRLTVPAHMAYGKQGAPPDIPPNATLVFDVECKAVN